MRSSDDDIALALMELARATKSTQSTFAAKVLELRAVLKEHRVPVWHSGKPFKGYAALQDILPCDRVLERVVVNSQGDGR